MKKVKKVPQRKCIVCQDRDNKKELMRIVKNKEGEIFIDLTGKANGRGAYLKKDKEVIEKARMTKTLERHLETKIPEEIYDELLNILKYYLTLHQNQLDFLAFLFLSLHFLLFLQYRLKNLMYYLFLLYYVLMEHT